MIDYKNKDGITWRCDPVTGFWNFSDYVVYRNNSTDKWEALCRTTRKTFYYPDLETTLDECLSEFEADNATRKVVFVRQGKSWAFQEKTDLWVCGDMCIRRVREGWAISSDNGSAAGPFKTLIEAMEKGPDRVNPEP